MRLSTVIFFQMRWPTDSLILASIMLLSVIAAWMAPSGTSNVTIKSNIQWIATRLALRAEMRLADMDSTIASR